MLIERTQTALKLIQHPIIVSKPQRKAFLKGILATTGLINRTDTPLMTVRQLAEWIHTSCRLCKTADNQEGINERSIETELYTLMKEND